MQTSRERQKTQFKKASRRRKRLKKKETAIIAMPPDCSGSCYGN